MKIVILKPLTYFVNTSSTMVAGTLKAFIDVDLAKLANGSMRTGTFERVN